MSDPSARRDHPLSTSDTMTRHRHYRGKRLLDMVVLTLVGPLALIVGAVCAVTVRLTSRGPALFRQERIGIDGQVFTVLKFRTMIDGDNPIIPSPDRITTVGRFLRRTSLDELPQLINVMRSEMSIVGPRPTLAYQVERWTEEQRHRLDVRPGLSGLAQVSGRNNLSWPERIDFDIEYVAEQSLGLDVRILARTAAAMLSGDGSGVTSCDDPIARVVEPVT